jgi:predicted RecB family nuclease
MASITAIDGIKEPYTERLRRLGIRTTEDLLAYGSTRRGRRELSKVVGLGDRRVTEWVKRADLLRVPGISTRYSNLLEAVGVTTVRDLRRRDPQKLHAALLDVNQRRRRPVVLRPPTEEDVRAWVDGARRLALVVRRW